MDAEILSFVIAGVAVAGAIAIYMIRKTRKETAARSWPAAEATIQTAGIEPVSMGRGYSDLPCFAFSYVVKQEYYSGRFALSAKGNRADELLRNLAGRKLTIHFDPRRPSSFFIPDRSIEDCEVYQLPD
jgi:hypothetical protein